MTDYPLKKFGFKMSKYDPKMVIIICYIKLLCIKLTTIGDIGDSKALCKYVKHSISNI